MGFWSNAERRMFTRFAQRSASTIMIVERPTGRGTTAGYTQIAVDKPARKSSLVGRVTSDHGGQESITLYRFVWPLPADVRPGDRLTDPAGQVYTVDSANDEDEGAVARIVTARAVRPTAR